MAAGNGPDNYSLPPTEGIIQKRGGGTSFLGSKAWTARYVRIEDGVLRYWKSQKDALAGNASCKNVAVTLSQYKLELHKTPADGYWSFEIKLKAGQHASARCRKSYAFRVHAKDHQEGWAAVFRAAGCVEDGVAKPNAQQQQAIFEDIAKTSHEAEKAEKVAAEAADKKPADDEASGAAAAPAEGKKEDAAGKGDSEEEEGDNDEEAEPTGPSAMEPAAPDSPPPSAPGDSDGEEKEGDENPVNAQWTAYRDEDGDIFYVSTENGESTWEKPEGFDGPILKYEDD